MNRVTHALRVSALAIGQAFVWTGRKVAEQISLVPTYLSHLLWLITAGFRELTEKGFKQNAACYACLKLLCTSVPEPPLIVHVRLPDGEPGEPLPWDHELRQLIRNPNGLMTEYEFWEMVTLHTGIAGRSTWWKERDRLGHLIALWPLRPDRVGPIYGSVGDGYGADGVLVGWSYQVPGTSNYIPIRRSDMLAFNFPDPMGESGGIVEGLGPLQVLASEVGADNEATKYVGSLLANDARPGTVLKVKGKINTEDDARLIKAAYTQEFGGRGRGKVGVVDSDTDVISIGFNMSELEFPALRRISESRICAAFGVPAILVGLLVGLEAGIRATIAEQREFFTETTLSSYWRRFSDQYTMDVASEFGLNLVCIFDVTKVRALAAQTAAELDRIRDAYDRGVITPNEYRDALNLAPHTDGNFLPAAQKPMLAAAVSSPESGTNVATMSPNGKVVDANADTLVAAA